MFPSSSRVKLNRVALKDVLGLKLVPRRRRVPVPAYSPKQEENLVSEPLPVKDTAYVCGSNESVQTFIANQMGPENETATAGHVPEGEPEENCVGTEKTKRRHTVRPCTEGDSREFKQEGPYTRGKYQQNKPHTRSKCRSGCLRKLCDLTLRFTCSFCTPSDRQIEGYRRVKTSKMSCQIELSSKPPRQGQITGKTGASHHVAVGGRDRGRGAQGRVKARSSGWDPPPAAAHTGRTGTSPRPNRLSSKPVKERDCSTGMWNRDLEQDAGPGSCLIGVEKRIKLGDNVKDGILPSTLNLKSNNYKHTEKTDSRDKNKTCFWMSDGSRSCSEDAVGVGSTLGSAVTENFQTDSPSKTDAADMSELWNEVHMDKLESFTCQRVRAYCRKNDFSCARTYMSWPFSNRNLTLTARAGIIACPADLNDRLDNSDSPINQNQPGSPSNRINNMLPNTPTDPSSDTIQTQKASHQNEEKQEEDRKSILPESNGKRHVNIFSSCSDSKNLAFTSPVMEAEESRASLASDLTTLSSLGQHGGAHVTGTDTTSSLPINCPGTISYTSTLSISAPGPSDWETVTSLSSMSFPFKHGGLSGLSATPSSPPPSSFLIRKVKNVELAATSSPYCMVKSVEKTLFYCEETQMNSCSSSSSAPSHNSESSQSCESALVLSKDRQDSDEELLRGRCPPKLQPYYYTSPIHHDLFKESSLHNLISKKCAETKFILPPVLSPVTSPQGCSQESFLPQSPGSSDEEDEDMNIGTCIPQILNCNSENSKDYLGHGMEELEQVSIDFKPLTSLRELQSSPSTDADVNAGNEVESRDKNVCENDVEQLYKKYEHIPSDPEIKAASSALAEPSSYEDDAGAFNDEEWPHTTRDKGSSVSEMAASEKDQTKAESAVDSQQSILDEITAYEKDILLVDVIQDDPDLFENLPQESLLKLGPTRVPEVPKTRPIGVGKTMLPRINGASQELKQRLTPVVIDFHCDSPDITEENNRPWRPQCRSSHSKTQSNAWPATEKQTKKMGQSDASSSQLNRGMERNQPIQTVDSLHNHILPPMNLKNGPRIPNPANVAEFRRQKSNDYCRQYFSESLSCGFKVCRFQHVPVEGDEKFCIETVMRFIKNPMCLQKAGAVFTGYYHNNPPGVHFSMPVLLSLLWALLKGSMVSDVFSVLSVSLAHRIVPGHEFLLALFNFVREKGLMGFVPELMQLTFKMASAGLVLSLDWLDSVKNTPELQQTIHPNSMVSVSGNKSSNVAPFPEYLNWAHAIVEIELCSKQEDWRRMGEVFRSVCQSSQRPNQLERISGRIAIALLSESKDKLSLPFAAFAETGCQNEGEDSLIRSFLGRIGVSLMLRYHKTHQWAKGRRVVEVLSISKVSYSTLKGLFGNEDRSSRCNLITVATELFLLSGCVEGALNTIRENKWFLSSSAWPCEPADLEGRTRVLIRLAEKTSHRDTLDVLCNLPGLKEPNDLVDISRYQTLFNSHLQVCVDRQTLPVASDTVDFMLSRNLAVDHSMLQMLLHKLGKQNLWLRAREVFRHSLSMGYYPGVSAPPGFMALIIPCQLGEVELALTFEMFITVNATAILHPSETFTYSLNITLKRNQSCEGEYLSAGSRLLSAACIPQPKLIVHYTEVNSSQEQVFRLDIPSARCWLRHNHLWANEVWTH